MTTAFEKDYNGKPLLTIQKDNSQIPSIQFGVKKARMVLEHETLIRNWLKRPGKTVRKLAEFVCVFIYNERPFLKLLRDKDDKFGFAFGVAKAEMLIEHIETIKAFAEKYKELYTGVPTQT